MQSVLDDVSSDELEMWARQHRKPGKPSNAEIESYKRRDGKIVDDLFGTPQGSPRTDQLIAASVQWAKAIMQKVDAACSLRSQD